MAPNMKYWTSIDRFFWSKSLYLITGQFYRPNLNSGLLCTIKAIKNFPQSELDEGFFPHCPGGLWYMKIRGQVEKSRENSFLIICMRPATKIKILLDVRNSNIRFKFFCEPVINLSSGLVIHVENNSGETSVLCIINSHLRVQLKQLAKWLILPLLGIFSPPHKSGNTEIITNDKTRWQTRNYFSKH